RDDKRVANLLSEHFTRSNSQSPSLRAWVRGTEFQVRVWRALLAIPPGQLTTYRRIAEAIGQPRASRAVGTAIGANPIALLIPCHRVIRETGVISGYRWGVGRKRSLIAWEGAKG
ncbi:MAG: MGMT family protein, partial [Verrucomicrobiae bacterium]|nr:MGMT family protein [Verrucomicrobiae bacterium]